LINSQTRKALTWLAKISTDKLAGMETNGIRGPILNTCTASSRHFNEAEMEEGRSRLLHLLHRCMISARKADLQSIPPCIKKVVYLDFNEEHARSYNELVITLRRNILMADWNDPSHVESLLNPKQWKFRRTSIKNVRLSCCVAGHIKVTYSLGNTTNAWYN